MKAIVQVFFALEHVFEMTSILSRAFLESQHEGAHDVLAYRPSNGSHLLLDVFLEVSDGPGLPRVHSIIEIAHREEAWGTRVFHF